MKILVLGANGQVGFELMRALASVGEVVAATRDGSHDAIEADLARPDSLAAALDAVDADIVVNAAAYTAVDRAEDEPGLADRVNHLAVGEIGAWAARRGAGVVHYSTDYVFDGSAKRPYRENDPTAPLGAYGRTKLDGENALRASGARHLILRTAWVYAARGHNFLLTMLRLARERDELRVVDDQVGAPTPARLIADATAAALASWHVALETRDTRFDGVHHLVSRGTCSWHDFASAIVSGAAKRGIIERAPRVVPIGTSDYPTRAKRPAYSVLDTERFKGAFGLQLPDWRAGLESALDELAS
ncbi:MAG TPA: dTDP-4-dehydrorhamnose reductase [Rhodanobacteraceae bacterium]|nr:dTDP-4-dehydrorhamnose reductase [Rhodanobacteraceae bacterium]